MSINFRYHRGDDYRTPPDLDHAQTFFHDYIYAHWMLHHYMVKVVDYEVEDVFVWDEGHNGVNFWYQVKPEDYEARIVDYKFLRDYVIDEYHDSIENFGE